MAEQVTEMVIKVDLQCRRCYKKIKKILCEIPQVKDLIFDEKQNKVKIKVVGCDPEKVRQKICCKGRDFILGVDIIPPEPPKKEEPKKEEKKEVKPPPVIGYPPGYMMGKVYVCISCHHGGCGWFCPCNCHCGGPPICADGCGRPAHECRCKRPLVCADGCGRPPHECRCKRPRMCPDGCGRRADECICKKPSMCHDGCGRRAHECICKKPRMCPDGCGRRGHECICKKPSMCHDGCGRRAHECSCQRPRMCADGCGRPAHECICKRPPMCHDGCGRPAHECSCQRPIYPWCCDRSSYGNDSSSWTLHGCDYGRPPVCTNAGYDCDTSCTLM